MSEPTPPPRPAPMKQPVTMDSAPPAGPGRMNDQEAYEFYKNPENLKPVGPGRRRSRPTKSTMAAVRFPPEVIEAVKAVADQEGITVSSWIRRAVRCAMPPPGEPRGRTFACPHMSIGNVETASCAICGPMTAAA